MTDHAASPASKDHERTIELPLRDRQAIADALVREWDRRRRENPPSSVSNPRTTMRDIALSGSLQSSQENPPSLECTCVPYYPKGHPFHFCTCTPENPPSPLSGAT
jgi:hypothetical protein